MELELEPLGLPSDNERPSCVIAGPCSAETEEQVLTTAKQLGTTVSLSGSSVPKKLADIIATYGEDKDDMRKAGIDYAVNQIRDLREHGVDGIHIYSMNKLKTTTEICRQI